MEKNKNFLLSPERVKMDDKNFSFDNTLNSSLVENLNISGEESKIFSQQAQPISSGNLSFPLNSILPQQNNLVNSFSNSSIYSTSTPHKNNQSFLGVNSQTSQIKTSSTTSFFTSSNELGEGDDSQIENLIRGMHVLNPKPIIFSASFLDAETLKQVFLFLTTVDVCPFHFTKDTISIFKTKQSNSDSKTPSMVINIKFDSDELYEYKFNSSLISHKSEGFHGFCANTKQLSAMTKNVKTNDIIKIYQYEGESIVRFTLISERSSADSQLNISEYISEKCQIHSNITSTDLVPNIRFSLKDFGGQCASLTRIKKIMAPVHFFVYQEGLSVYSDNLETLEKKWGLIQGKKFHFIFSDTMIKSVGMIKKFNTRGVVKIFAVDNVLLRIDTSIGSIGYINLYLLHQTSV